MKLSQEHFIAPIGIVDTEISTTLDDSRSSHRMRHNQRCFHGHPDVVPAPMIRFECQVLSRTIVSQEGTLVLAIALDILPEHHFGRLLIIWAAVRSAVQTSQWVIIGIHGQSGTGRYFGRIIFDCVLLLLCSSKAIGTRWFPIVALLLPGIGVCLLLWCHPLLL